MEDSFLNEVADAFDEAFEAATGTSPLKPEGAASAAHAVRSDEALQPLFAEIAAVHARPVKNFIFRLQRGTAGKDWIRFCRPVLRSIQSAAQTLELRDTVERISEFEEVLQLAEKKPERWLMGETRHQILEAYQTLVDALPQTFQAGEEGHDREEIIFQALLSQIPGIGKVNLTKLHRVGLCSLSSLLSASAEDLASMTGLPLRLADRICHRVRRYRDEITGFTPEFAEIELRSRVEEIVKQLRQLETTRGSAQTALRSRRRTLREQGFLQITLLLAELGEVELTHSLQRLSAKKRLRQIEAYLAS